MEYFVLKYMINHESYIIVIKAETLENAKKIVEELPCNFDKLFIKTINQIKDWQSEMLIASVASVWN